MGLDSVIPIPRAGLLSFDELQRLSDERVMAAVQNGQADALAVLYDRYHRLVYSIALKIVRDAGESEDVTQNVFLEVFRSAAQFDPARGTCKVWLLQYAYHRAINRRQQLQLRNFYDTLELDSADGQPAASSNALSAQDSSRLLKQGLAVLNRAQRRVVEMACFDGLTMREIAARTGESLPNVRHHYYRGLDKLRKFMQPDAKPAAAAKGTE